MKNKNFAYIFILFGLIFISCNNSDVKNEETITAVSVSKKDDTSTQLKRYQVKSGIVKYKTKVSGTVMGTTINGSGTEELYFKNWGATELKKEDSKKITKINILGQKKTDVTEKHSINKLDNGKSYHVDIKNKLIYLRRDPAMEMMKAFNDGDVVDPGKKMLESIGGKIVGKEKIKGYTCDVWQIPGGKQWIYKGLPLKLTMTMMGITTTTEITSAKFNINVSDSYFKLPNYPIKKEEGYRNDKEYNQDKAEMKKNAKKLQNMTFAQYKEMLKKEDPEEYKNMSEKELKQGYQIIKKMSARMAK